MAGPKSMSSDVDIDMVGLVMEIWRKKFLLALIIGATAVGLFMLFSGMDPRYRSDARILIENRESVFTRPQEQGSTSNSAFDEQAINSQVQVVSSDELALKVIDRLKLADHPEFSGEASPSLISDILTVLGLSAAPERSVNEARMLSKFRERLGVYAPETSRVIVVEFWSRNPELARDVPNALAEEYLAFNREAKRISTEEATEWLGPEIDELRDRVREAEAKVAQFRSSSDILIGSNNSLLATQQLSEASSELSRIRAERSQAEAKAEAVRAALSSGGSIDVVPEVIASPLIQRLREREVELQAQISELSTALLDNHPRLQALRSQRADFRQQIRSAAGNILTSLQNNVDLYERQEATLNERINRLKAEAARVNEAEVELRALEREAAAQRQLLETYMTQYREAASRTSREYLPVDARIISRAILPASPYFPKVLPFTIAGTLAMAIISVTCLLAWALMSGKALKPVGRVDEEMLPDTVETVHEPEREARVVPMGNPHPVYRRIVEPPARRTARRTERPVIAETAQASGPENETERVDAAPPLFVDEEDRPVPPPPPANDEGSFPFRYALDAIRSLEHARIVMVAPAGDNGSLTAWHLARMLAAHNKSVVIVDLTGSAVTSHHFLGEGEFTGLRDMLAGGAEFQDAIYQDPQSDAHILPIGRDAARTPANPMDRLASIARALDAAYDFVIFDCGCAAPQSIGGIAEGEALVLISQEGVQKDEALESEAEFRAAGFDDAVVIRLEPEDRERALADAA